MQTSGNSPAGPVRAIQASSGGYERGRGKEFTPSQGRKGRRKGGRGTGPAC